VISGWQRPLRQAQGGEPAIILAGPAAAEDKMFEGLFQPAHLIIILVIALFVFGPKRLPELGKSLGQGIRGFRDALQETQKQLAASTEEPKDQDAAAKG